MSRTPDLAIGIPCSKHLRLPLEFVRARDGLIGRLAADGVHAITIWSESYPTDVARNEICRTALELGAPELLFVDADHVVEPTLFRRLAAHGKPVISARYHATVPPFHAIAFVTPAGVEPGPGRYRAVQYGQGVFEIERGGAGALLIQRRVLEAIGEGWFSYAPDPTSHHDRRITEDFAFYQQARGCGFGCWLDWETEVRHIGQMEVGGEHAAAMLRQAEAEIDAERAGQVIACGGSVRLGDHVIHATIVQPEPETADWAPAAREAAYRRMAERRA